MVRYIGNRRSVGRNAHMAKNRQTCKRCNQEMLATKRTSVERLNGLCLRCKKDKGYIKREKVTPLWDLKKYRKEEE